MKALPARLIGASLASVALGGLVGLGTGFVVQDIWIILAAALVASGIPTMIAGEVWLFCVNIWVTFLLPIDSVLFVVMFYREDVRTQEPKRIFPWRLLLVAMAIPLHLLTTEFNQFPD